MKAGGNAPATFLATRMPMAKRGRLSEILSTFRAGFFGNTSLDTSRDCLDPEPDYHTTQSPPRFLFNLYLHKVAADTHVRCQPVDLGGIERTERMFGRFGPASAKHELRHETFDTPGESTRWRVIGP